MIEIAGVFGDDLAKMGYGPVIKINGPGPGRWYKAHNYQTGYVFIAYLHDGAYCFNEYHNQIFSDEEVWPTLQKDILIAWHELTGKPYE